MAFGIYVHIPYCKQICTYCDFSKYEQSKIMPPTEYVELIKKEISDRSAAVGPREVDTIYFGGGTPSLFDPSLIVAIKDHLANEGFGTRKSTEVSIEIDPGTADQKRIEGYLEGGVTRFSVGAQTFHDHLLKAAGRKHSPADTLEMLTILRNLRVNYSFDLLFGLPKQSLDDVRTDVDQALEYSPSHLSAYCLTVPEKHPMNIGRAPDEDQVQMFTVIEDGLRKAGILRYEISNFAKPGAESKHNLLYWTDEEYWGVGVSSHSFLKRGEFGTRFWNPKTLSGHVKQVTSSELQVKSPDDLPASQVEVLALNQALTDFCHTSLRLTRGLSENALRLKFGEKVSAKVISILGEIERSKYVELVVSTGENFWRLTPSGRVLANVIFEKLTFLKGEV